VADPVAGTTDALDVATYAFQVLGTTICDALQDMEAAIINGSGKEEPTGILWDSLENKPPGACIGGQTPINRNYYYYVWFEEPPTEGKSHEQETDP